MKPLTCLVWRMAWYVGAAAAAATAMPRIDRAPCALRNDHRILVRGPTELRGGGDHQLSLPLEQLLLVSLAGVLLGSGLRRLRPSFRVRQLSHRSKLQRKQVNLKSR